MKKPALILIYLGMIFLAVSCSKSDHAREKRDTVNSLASNPGSVYDIDMQLEDQNGKSDEWQSLGGKIRVVAMIYTHCPTTCPIITQRIKEVEAKIPVNTRIGYTLISFDSKRDTAGRLREYYNEQGLDTNWLLLHGSPEDVRTIAELLNIQYKEWEGGDFTHSNLIFVIDSKGHIVLRQAGLDTKDKDIIARVILQLSPSI